jgi:hypothetical protein
MERSNLRRPTTYPRIPRSTAESLLEEQRQLPISQLPALAATSHRQQEWHPTIPARVTDRELQQLRTDIVGIASENGYPVPQPRGRHVPFDQMLAVHLYQQMGIVAAEAAAGGIWSFLALVLLPDIAAWRFSDRHRDRFIGADLMIGSSNRHVFGRLWARVHILGAEASSGLGEDNVVNLFERPTFGGDPRLARAIGETHIRTIAANRIIQSQELMRDAMKWSTPGLVETRFSPAGPGFQVDLIVAVVACPDGRKSGFEELASQGGEHVGGCGLGLGLVPRAEQASSSDVGGLVAPAGVPADHQGLHQEGERDTALDGLLHPVAGVPGAGELLAGGVGRLDGQRQEYRSAIAAGLAVVSRVNRPRS